MFRSTLFLLALFGLHGFATDEEPCSCTVVADVVSLNQAWQASRLGSTTPAGMIYALAQDVVPSESPTDAHGNDLHTNINNDMVLEPGKVRLRSGKRPRPLVLRVNEGECLEIRYRNLLVKNAPPGGAAYDPPSGIHVAGLESVGVPGQAAIQSDGTFVGVNPDAVPATGETIVYKLYARAEGVYFLYDDANYDAANKSLQAGLFGAVTVQPPRGEYYRSQVTRTDLEAASQTKTKLGAGQRLEPVLDAQGKALVGLDGHEVYRLIAMGETGEVESRVLVTAEGKLKSEDGHPLVDYQAVYPDGRPILRMDWPSADGKTRQLYHSDLTAIITGPHAGSWPLSQRNPSFTLNSASPNRRQPYREFAIMYHQLSAHQAFPQMNEGPLKGTLGFGSDGFAINYGSAGIAAEVLANRFGVGPAGYHGDGADMKFEEFFLSSWSNGDPAILTDLSAGSQTGEQGPERERATRSYFPDDPSNVYHSYLRDHVKFRVLNVNSIPHVHHLHAHQWLHSPNSDNGHYLDSQLISGGSTYTAEITYNGSGNRNQTVGDSIFHCHFYPHFAQGLWGLWRVHDVFEWGTQLNFDGTIKTVDRHGEPIWNRALPDGEIVSGTPIPGVVPLPTLAMAPIPAPVRLATAADPTIDGLEMAGRRVIVEPMTGPDGEVVTGSDGAPTYENPGFPFFIPSVAGHRPVHPPMDFAWLEDDAGNPVLDPDGNKILLDGGLPRHQALNGEIVRDLFTNYDFSRDFILFSTENKAKQSEDTYLTGSFTAYQVPEDGTAVEKAAMAFHAQRSHRTVTPEGRVGHFITNGLPPEPGAPFAAPNVDDEGNAVGDLIRYKAADIQMDAVFNKKGWHYPQQRLISLWDDVAPTIQGKRPPEPFFFRSHSGDSIEFWHTNLIPNYFAMDDFQVRTPTDILGQHIHLVKFDVTSSDGAANGFNYEDGTFSPDEVRERIIAINKNPQGGIYGFDPVTQFASSQTSPLTIKDYASFYQFGEPPYDQNWDGAQTTIQRWYSDPLLNNLGDDRTLRTVFTHDHFSPSTHQQAGLYAGLLVEPQGSNWFTNGVSYSKPGSYFKLDESGDLVAYTSTDGKLDPGTEMYQRRDGGPTSWQAMIHGEDPETSYREFALEFQDLGLSYLPTSTFESRPQQVALGSIFTFSASSLAAGPVPTAVADVFFANGVALESSSQIVAPNTSNNCGYCGESPSAPDFILVNTTSGPDGCATDAYALIAAGSTYSVYPLCWASTWYEPEQAIANIPLFGKNPTLISGFPFSGIYSVNYRNEPIPSRVDTRASFEALSTQAVDLSYAYTSQARLDDELNQQPIDSLINPNLNGPGGYSPTEPLPFTYPVNQLNSNVSDYDPYTPLMNAYQGDRIQIRTLVGAHDRTHTFRLLGHKWLAEPQNPNSGYRSTQDMGISEHYEMLFTLGAADTGSRGYADWLWEANSTQIGQETGMWGLLRGYTEDPQTHSVPLANQSAPLLKLPNNPNPDEKTAALLARWAEVRQTFEQLPSFKTLPAKYREFQVVATSVSQILSDLSAGTLYFNERGQVCDGDDCTDTYYSDSAVLSPFALMYVLASDLNNLELDSLLQFGAPLEPLVLRVNAGDWMRVTLTNQLQTHEVGQVATTQGLVTALDSGQVPSAIASALGLSGTTSVCDVISECAWRISSTNGEQTETYYVSRQADTLRLFDRATPFSLMSPQENLSPFVSSAGLSQTCFPTSDAVGFNPQMVAMDVATGQGLNVGFNPDQTAAPGDSVTYYWYAGDLQVVDGAVEEQPIEFGAINLQGSDLVTQYRYGLYAALVVEPENSTWLVDAGTRLSATVFPEGLSSIQFKAGAAPFFREAVVLTQENAMLFSPYNPATNPLQSVGGSPLGPSGDVPVSGSCETLLQDVALQGYNNQGGTSTLFNYRTEPMAYRYALAHDGVLNKALTGNPMTQSSFDKYSNTILPGYDAANPYASDPQTSVFHAAAGTPVRVRWLYAGGLNEQVATIYGHSWQEEPFTDNSTVMGHNPQSQQLGTQQFGPNQSYNFNLASAGGAAQTPGDYLITQFEGFNWGNWGLLRVSDQLIVLTEARNWGNNLRLTGLVMNGDQVAANAAVLLEVQDEHGDPVPGFATISTTTDAKGRFKATAAKAPVGSYVCARLASGVCGQADGSATTAPIQSVGVLPPASLESSVPAQGKSSGSGEE